MATVTRPGPGTVVVAGVVVAVSTVAVPSTQVIVVPVCEQVVDCAWALPDKARNVTAIDALLSSTTRNVEWFIKLAPSCNRVQTPRLNNRLKRNTFLPSVSSSADRRAIKISLLAPAKGWVTRAQADLHPSRSDPTAAPAPHRHIPPDHVVERQESRVDQSRDQVAGEHRWLLVEQVVDVGEDLEVGRALGRPLAEARVDIGHCGQPPGRTDEPARRPRRQPELERIDEPRRYLARGVAAPGRQMAAELTALNDAVAAAAASHGGARMGFAGLETLVDPAVDAATDSRPDLDADILVGRASNLAICGAERYQQFIEGPISVGSIYFSKP